MSATAAGASLGAIFLALLLLQAKHFVFDYVLQTPFQYLNKGRYGHPGGVLHAGLHVIGTTAAFLAITPGLALGAFILAAEFVLHYHIDWTKEQVMRRWKLSPDMASYWYAHGADQFMHQATYIGIVALLAQGAG